MWLLSFVISNSILQAIEIITFTKSIQSVFLNYSFDIEVISMFWHETWVDVNKCDFVFCWHFRFRSFICQLSTSTKSTKLHFPLFCRELFLPQIFFFSLHLINVIFNRQVFVNIIFFCFRSLYVICFPFKYSETF